MVTKIQLAAMGRADMLLEDRKPFYLYVDEFQNFATDSFAVILSEARKYGLNLTVANQYVAQMPETVADAVFGNVGTMISFRVGPNDSTVLSKYFEPTFEATDITRLNNQNIFLSMIIDGEKTIPFSANTLRRPDPENNLFDQIVVNSRAAYASERADVETDIRSRTEDGQDQGARAVDTMIDSRPAAPLPGATPSRKPEDQKPNTPKSEFLAALKNPEHTPAPQPNREEQPQNQNQNSQNRSNQNRHHDNRKPQQGSGAHRSDKDSRDAAVRAAIRDVQSQTPQHKQ
jgi:hypothetical protein